MSIIGTDADLKMLAKPVKIKKKTLCTSIAIIPLITTDLVVNVLELMEPSDPHPVMVQFILEFSLMISVGKQIGCTY